MLYSPSPLNLLFHPILHGYYNKGESGHNAIDVARVVVVVQVAVVVHIIEVGRVGQVRRALPPVISGNPTTMQHTSARQQNAYSECNLKLILIMLNRRSV